MMFIYEKIGRIIPRTFSFDENSDDLIDGFNQLEVIIFYLKFCGVFLSLDNNRHTF